MNRKETREGLERKLKEKGFEDCLRFLDLADSLKIEGIKRGLVKWNSIRNCHDRSEEYFRIAVERIIGMYSSEYEEFIKLADQYLDIEEVNQIYGELVPQHEEFMKWLKERKYL